MPPPATPPERSRPRAALPAWAAPSALRELALTFGPFVLLGLLLVALAYRWLDPAPPRQVVLATGIAQGAYAEFGQRYAEQLRRHGIRVTLRATQGAAENLALLREAGSGVDIAFVQGGADELAPAPGQPAADAAGRPEDGLVSLGRMFHEPVWLFYREAAAQRRLGRGVLPTRLVQLQGWTLNVGAAGSGVPPLMARLLSLNGLAPQAVQLSNLATTPAVVELLEGRLDALALATAPEAPMVQMLLRTPGIRLLDLAQSEAYARRLPFLNPVLLPRGVADLAADLPATDMHLVAPTATLVARESLHPALVQLFMQAAQQVHGGAGWFQRKGEFPNAADTERPLAPEAQRFYRSGTPWLQRWLPFWLANLADRMWVVLLAIVAVLIPLSRVLPPIYEFRIRSRVFRWYARLRAVEAAQGQRPAAELLAELDAIEQRVSAVMVPLSHTDALYALRSHIQLVRRRLQA
ncbi:TAXI family TRAP transporter solute-binding subunit [Aquabacterium sp. OR-4]|uniref:TAXI family TRAP transporter solute-binding subunit n=1 Tax=Aquabacterium sp. OR-4 TaxID=2978127 RepID=UPI0021B16FBD|nr:TAXI family TRAP transporter solute-binding subunit [Aquabacterium sp. OR-4]MDT7837855.1 TAXI family TRAP transporter solute-binding subunit [Aquabacterium sp. OR-4]